MAGYGRMDVSQGGGPQQQVQAHQQLPLVEPPAVAAVAAAAAQAAQAQQNQVQQGPQPPALASVPALAGPSQAGQQQQPLIPVGAGVVPAPSPQPVVVGPIPQAQGPSAINGAAGVIQPPQVSLDYIIRGAGTFLQDYLQDHAQFNRSFFFVGSSSTSTTTSACPATTGGGSSTSACSTAFHKQPTRTRSC